MENNNELRPVLYIRDGKKVIEIEMYREQKYVVEFSYYQEDEEGWGSGTDEYLSREDLTNMAEGIRTIFRRERDSFEYSCSADIFRLGLSYNPNEDRYTFTAALKEKGTAIDYALDIEMSDQAIIDRMAGRRVCAGCGATFHTVNVPPKVEGVCDSCGGELQLRDDDKPETVKKRLGVYHEQTAPLIEYYKNQGILHEIDGTLGIVGVAEAIAKVMG